MNRIKFADKNRPVLWMFCSCIAALILTRVSWAVDYAGGQGLLKGIEVIDQVNVRF